jgi:hypothetical protein
VTDVRGQCKDNLQLVDCFIQNKQGYCEFFATAMVMLMRELGVPARYVLGYLPGKDPENDGTWSVDRGAAHAWVEVWFPTYGWVEFDPTPGNGENGQEATVLPPGPRVDPPSTIGPPLGEDPNPPSAPIRSIQPVSRTAACCRERLHHHRPPTAASAES